MGELRPPALDECGLENALRDYLAAVSAESDLKADLVAGLGANRLPPDTETLLYRVAQEAVLNTVQHAAASHLSLRLERTGSFVVLSINDDGVGFTEEEARARLLDGHFGLVGMRERIQLSGGTWHLDSVPGHGTRITAAIPDGPLPDPTPSPRSNSRVGVAA